MKMYAIVKDGAIVKVVSTDIQAMAVLAIEYNCDPNVTCQEVTVVLNQDVSLNTEKDCRLCYWYGMDRCNIECSIHADTCTNGSEFKPSDPVHLYGKEG